VLINIISLLIDVEKIFENLQEGETESGFYCESCGLIAITRNDNNLQVMRSKDDKLVNWENY
jgi:hypothetical protein